MGKITKYDFKETNNMNKSGNNKRKRIRWVVFLVSFIACFFFIDKTTLIKSIGDIVVQHDNSTVLDIIVFITKTIISTILGILIATFSSVIEKLTSARIKKYTELPYIGLFPISKRSIERRSLYNNIDYECINIGSGKNSVYFQVSLVNTGDSSIASCSINKHSLHIKEISPGNSIIIYINIIYSKLNKEMIQKVVSLRYTDINGNRYLQKYNISISKESFDVIISPLEGRKEIRNA